MSFRISMVSYVNTLPFMEALKTVDDQFLISEKIPRLCGEDFISGSADIALLPCGFLPQLGKDSFTILKDFGIACEGAVRSVKLLSHVPLSRIDKIHLDRHSTSSSKLLNILSQHHWKISPSYETIDIEQGIRGDSVLMIGDKVFEHESNYAFHYDLGAVWQDFTGLPFVFAVWVAKPSIPSQVINQLNEVFRKGILNLPRVISDHKLAYPKYDIERYLGEHIKYELDDAYHAGLSRYLGFLKGG